jgi:hypothetical protein
MSLFGGRGGLRIDSLHRAQRELGLEPFWQLPIGNYLLVGVTSSLLALPVFEVETLAAERDAWRQHRSEHLDLIRNAFAALHPAQRVILFCHDPTALPFLWHDDQIRRRTPQIESTIIGHLHSPLLLWKSKLLSGMPTIRFLGNSIRRMSAALHEARLWRHFRVTLCPALAGIELLKDGGYYRILLDPAGHHPLRFQLCRPIER